MTDCYHWKWYHWKTLESESQKDKKENENENDETLMSSKDGNKNILLECIGDFDDNLFKKYSDGKNLNSFINKFDRATNEKIKKK